MGIRKVHVQGRGREREGRPVGKREGGTEEGREGGRKGGREREERPVGKREGGREWKGRRMSGSKKDTCTRRAREGRCVERTEGATMGYHTG